jgi:group I intron endonuclease
MKTTGIYQIINIINNHSYIGSSKNIYKRWKTHLRALKNNKHHSIYLQRAYNKYGIDSFNLIIIEQTNKLFKQEKYWINKLSPEYNVGSVGGGDNISNHPNLEQIRKKHSINSKARYQNETIEQKIQRCNNIKGNQNPNWRGGKTFFVCPICHKELRVTGKYKQKTCAKCRQINGKNNPFFNKHHSKETKEKIRLKKLGQKPKNSRCVVINNILYKSYSDASKAVNISIATISNRVKKGIYTATSPDNLGHES